MLTETALSAEFSLAISNSTNCDPLWITISPEKKRKASESTDSGDEVPDSIIEETHSKNQKLMNLLLGLCFGTLKKLIGQAPNSTIHASPHIDLPKITVEWEIFRPIIRKGGRIEEDESGGPSDPEWPWSTMIWLTPRSERRMEIGQTYGTLIQRDNIPRSLLEDMTRTDQDAASLALNSLTAVDAWRMSSRTTSTRRDRASGEKK